jgi:hypothetical protein
MILKDFTCVENFKWDFFERWIVFTCFRKMNYPYMHVMIMDAKVQGITLTSEIQLVSLHSLSLSLP